MDINKFCAASDDPRTYLQEPMQFGDLTVATNGHVLLFSPEKSEFKAPPSDTNIGLEKLHLEISAADTWQPLTEITLPDKIDCKRCSGAGVLHPKKCYECDGDGEAIAETLYNEYEVPCMTCDGEGYIIDGEPAKNDESVQCDRCDGERQHWDLDAEGMRVVLLDVHLHPKYASLLKEYLPLEIASDSESILYFRKGDYSGAVMGLRK